MFLTVVVFIEPIAQLFIAKEQYLEGLSIVPIVLYAALFLGIYHSLSVWYKIIDKPIIGTYISGGGALITLLITIIFIPRWGYYAGAIVTCLLFHGLAFFFAFKEIQSNSVRLKKHSYLFDIGLSFSLYRLYPF